MTCTSVLQSAGQESNGVIGYAARTHRVFHSIMVKRNKKHKII